MTLVGGELGETPLSSADARAASDASSASRTLGSIPARDEPNTDALLDVRFLTDTMLVRTLSTEEAVAAGTGVSAEDGVSGAASMSAAETALATDTCDVTEKAEALHNPLVSESRAFAVSASDESSSAGAPDKGGAEEFDASSARAPMMTSIVFARTAARARDVGESFEWLPMLADAWSSSNSCDVTAATASAPKGLPASEPPGATALWDASLTCEISARVSFDVEAGVPRATCANAAPRHP